MGRGDSNSMLGNRFETVSPTLCHLPWTHCNASHLAGRRAGVWGGEGGGFWGEGPAHPAVSASGHLLRGIRFPLHLPSCSLASPPFKEHTHHHRLTCQ